MDERPDETAEVRWWVEPGSARLGPLGDILAAVYGRAGQGVLDEPVEGARAVVQRGRGHSARRRLLFDAPPNPDELRATDVAVVPSRAAAVHMGALGVRAIATSLPPDRRAFAGHGEAVVVGTRATADAVRLELGEPMPGSIVVEPDGSIWDDRSAIAAMSLGWTPIVFGRLSATADLVQHGHNGIIVEGSVSAVVDGARHLSQHGEQRSWMGFQAALACSRLTWDRVARRLMGTGDTASTALIDDLGRTARRARWHSRRGSGLSWGAVIAGDPEATEAAVATQLEQRDRVVLLGSSGSAAPAPGVVRVDLEPGCRALGLVRCFPGIVVASGAPARWRELVATAHPG